MRVQTASRQEATGQPRVGQPRVGQPRVGQPAPRGALVRDLPAGMHTVCLLRLLERIALRFTEAQIPLLALKGAALNLTIHARPGARPMNDLDIMVRPEHAQPAMQILAAMGCRPGRPLVRSDFFPRYHYERDFTTGRVTPLRIDLHVRPFRPLRYSRTVPANAFWQDAQPVRVGRSEVLVPGVEDMLLHLAVHSAVHGNARPRWLADLKHWADAWTESIDWATFAVKAWAWGLVPPAHAALTSAEKTCGAIRPPAVRAAMARYRPGWRELRVLQQAPDDAHSALRHVLTEALCTPGLVYCLGYLRATLLPDRAHLAEWYDRRHAAWVATARILRLLAPLLRRWPRLWDRVAKVEIRHTPRGAAVFARRLIRAGERVFACGGEGGKLACTRHSCQPNVKRVGKYVAALRMIAPGEEIRLDFGLQACDCRRSSADASAGCD